MNILISLLGCLVVGLSSVNAQKLRWCVTSQNEMKKCQYLVTKSPDLECHLKSSLTECMISIKDGEADAVTVDGEHIYRAGILPYNLRPIIKEETKEKCCYAVAVVKKDTDFTINNLHGKTSCHSCYRTPGGWNIPLGRLIEQNKIIWDGPDDIPLEKAVSWFFSSSCVPGISKAQYPKLCQACQGDCSCSKNEKYSGDEGALQCLRNGHGQVAFVCQHAIPPRERQNYQLLCLDGSRKSVEEYKDCYFAKEPSRAVISRINADSQQIYNVLKQIQKDIQQTLKASFDYSSIVLNRIQIFTLLLFLGVLMFSDSTSELVLLPKSTDSFIYLREDYYEAMHALTVGNMPDPFQHRNIEWCTISRAEQHKCDKLNVHIPDLQCTRASSVEDCIKKIMRREADAIAVDSAHVYTAGKCGLVPVMLEQYDQERCDIGRDKDSSYYVVAVVKKGSGVTWNTLKGRKSSHTALDTSSWIALLSAICKKIPGCTLYYFFSKGCAPGADPKSNMCELCKGSGTAIGDVSKCKVSHDEMYYGHDGAFRCLAEKNSEVAFIRHNILGEYTDGKGPDWAMDLKSEDFELICPESPDKSVKHIDFAKCYLAKVPAHVVITREDARAAVVNVLKKAQVSPLQATSDNLFRSEGDRNLLFSDSTKCLQEFTGSVSEYLTRSHSEMIERTYIIDQYVPDLVKACNESFCG